MDNQLPDDVLRRCHDLAVNAATDLAPEVRDAISKALLGDGAVMVAHAHNVEGRPFVYVRVVTDDGRQLASMELPGAAVGVSIDADGDLVTCVAG